MARRDAEPEGDVPSAEVGCLGEPNPVWRLFCSLQGRLRRFDGRSHHRSGDIPMYIFDLLQCCGVPFRSLCLLKESC